MVFNISTPTQGCWLNVVESFFSRLTKQMLNSIRVLNKENLENRIRQYFHEINNVLVLYH